MNKQALAKLAQIRLAINHVLRQRMIKKADWSYDPNSSGNVSTDRLNREKFFQQNKSYGPRIPLSIGIPWTGIRYEKENINPFYLDPAERGMRIRYQNSKDQRNHLLPSLRGTHFNEWGMKQDPDRKYYDQNKRMLDNYRSHKNLLPSEYLGVLDNMEFEFKQMYPEP